MTHPSNPDMVMARALGVCWHPSTSDRWPCTARTEPGSVPGDGWAASETAADHPLRALPSLRAPNDHEVIASWLASKYSELGIPSAHVPEQDADADADELIALLRGIP